MNRGMQAIAPVLGCCGRVLLGLYFLLPGISKIVGFDATSAYMATHGVPMVGIALVVTIVPVSYTHLTLPTILLV